MNYINKPEKYYINNKIDQLKCFCLTVQYQTIKEAEKYDIYSQSTISMQLASLEYDLQTKLLQSVQKKLKLTKNGEEFYLKAQQILTKLTKFYLPSVSNLGLIKKPIHNYKKNKLEQIQSFCLVAENQNIEKVAIKTDMSEATILMQIASLEYDLQTKLFLKPEKNRFILTKNGKYYYKFGREILNDIAEFYSKPKMKIKNLFWLAIKQKTKHLYSKTIKKIKTNFIKISLKKMIIIASILTIILSSSTAFYLNYTNYFFDKKIEKIANPLLKKLIHTGIHRLSEDNPCQMDEQTINMDVYDMLFKLMKNTKYHNIYITQLLLADHPLGHMRFSGDNNIDIAFNDKKYIVCDTQKSYIAQKNAFHIAETIFQKNKNFKIYNLYHQSLDTCFHCDIFFQNMQKYPHQLFGEKIIKPNNIPNIRLWIIKYDRYYYIFLCSNIMKNLSKTENKERYLIYKKLTKQKLKEYDSGSYWKLIKDYNIKID